MKDLEGIDKEMPDNAKLEWKDKNKIDYMTLWCTPLGDSYWKGGKVKLNNIIYIYFLF